MKVLSIAPTRLSLFGGGSDVNPYASIYGGLCINMAINLRQQFILDDEGYELVPSLKIIKGGNPDFYMKFFEEMEFYPNLVQKADMAIESGLGTSASAAVALISAISKFKGLKMTKDEIAEKAWDIEVNKIGLFGGKQDQYCAAFGGFNLMKFGKEVKIQGFPRRVAEKVSDHLLLFDTGIRRKDPKLQENLKEINEEQKQALDKIKQIANDAYHRIYKGDIKGLGKLLDDTWNYKKKSNKVTTPEIDKHYEIAKKIGAYGGKICGSGGGGCMVFIAPKDKHNDLIEGLDMKYVDHGGICWCGVTVREL